MDNIKISNMTISDLSLISNNLISDFDAFWSVDNVRSELNNPNSKYIIMKKNNTIIGFRRYLENNR